MIVGLSVLTGIISSCSAIDSSSSNNTYEKKIAQFAEKYGVTSTEVICSKSGRVGQCILSGTSGSFSKLVKRLNLRDFESKEIEDDFKYHNYWLDYKERRKRYDVAYTCGSLKNFSNLQSVKVYGNLDRSPELTLKDVGTFEHFFLYHSPDSNEACVHFTHAYG